VESKLGPLGTSATEWPIVRASGDYDDGEFCGMKIGRGSRSIRRKPAPASLCPPQIPLAQTRAAAVDILVKLADLMTLGKFGVKSKTAAFTHIRTRECCMLKKNYI
jgi:hypothetical protein